MGGVDGFPLPKAPLKFDRGPKGPLVFDFIRKKWLAARPEELVRLTLAHFLIYDKGYPAGLIELETPLSSSLRSFRADMLVRDRQGNPWLLAECKASDVPLDGVALKQAANYAARLPVAFLLLCNGGQCMFLNLGKLSDGWRTGVPEYPQ